MAEHSGIGLAEGSTEAPLLVIAGIRNKRSLGWEAVTHWLEADPEHSVLATVRSERSRDDVQKLADKTDGRVALVEVDWVKPKSPNVLRSALREILGEERGVAGVVHAVASANNINFKRPAHNLPAHVYKGAVDATAFSLVRLVQGAKEHMVDGAGVVTYGFGDPGRSMEGYGGALTVAKAALSQLVVELALSLGQETPRARTAEIVPGYIPTLSARGAIGLGGGDSADVEKYFTETAALAGTDASRQRDALGEMTVAFMTSPAFAQTTGTRLMVDGGWFTRGSLAVR